MAAVETSIASGRVATPLKKRVDEKIRRRGLSPSDLIACVYSYLDTHDDIPWIEAADSSAGTNLFEQFDSLVASMPVGTPLDALTPEDLRRELANRD